MSRNNVNVLLNFPTSLKTEFPGFLDDSEVDGGDLTSWIDEHLEALSTSAEDTKQYIANLEKRLIRQAAYNVEVSTAAFTKANLPALLDSIATELASCGFEMIEHSVDDPLVKECLNQLQKIHNFEFAPSRSSRPKF